MTFSKAMQVFCLLLALAVQVLIAQHTSVHPIESASFGVHQSVDSHDHDDHTAGGHGCDLCAMITAIAHGLGAAGFVALSLLTAYALNRRSFERAAVLRPVRVNAYLAQGPPVSF